MKKIIPPIVCLCILLAPTGASARIIGVPGDSPTIQAGIDASTPGDTVLVQPGRYLETIDFKGKDIVLGSLYITTQDTSYISKTIIDAQQKNTVVTFQTGETAAAVLCGFTITNGKSWGSVIHPEYNSGGGICCKGASPYLHNLKIEENSSPLDGGGMYLKKSNSIIEFCVIRKNTASSSGGGIYLESSDKVLIKHSIINNNKAGWGDGVMCLFSGTINATLDHVLFYNNYQTIYVADSNIDITNCTIFDDRNGNAINSETSSVTIVNTIIWTGGIWGIYSYVDPKNTGSIITISHSNIKNGIESVGKGVQDSLYWYDGNISIDPLFENQSKYIYSLSNNSPCIDSGTNFFSLGNRSIVNLAKGQYKGMYPDMGAIESDFTITNNINNDVADSSINLSNFPNPFNESTLITFNILSSSKMKLTIYNISGQIVSVHFQDYYSSGYHGIKWIPHNLSSGIYFLKLEAGGLSQTKKMLFYK